MKKIIYITLLLFFLCSDIPAQQTEKLIFGTGAFGIFDDYSVFMSSIELLLEETNRRINPKLGLMYTSGNTIYTYAGIVLKQPVFFGLSLSASFAPGFYYSFEKDILGHVLEFNSGLEIDYKSKDNSELSLSFHHVSNGGLAKFNPGAEYILLSFAIPLSN